MMDAYGSSQGTIDLHDDLGSSDGNHSTSGRPGSLPLSCKECRASKVKCERVFPCARCSRLGLSCSPQVRKKRRQPTKPAAAPVPTFQINTLEGVRYMKHTPISSLVKAFFECKEAGTLNKARTLCFFRSWARVRELYGLKSLEVVHDMMLKGLGVDDWRDLIHDEALSREMLMYTGEDGVSPEETSPGMPKPTGAHVIDSLPFFMKELFYSTNCASKMTVCEDVLPVSFANDLFDRLFNPTPSSSSESLFFLPPKSGGQDYGMSLSECMIRAIHPTDGAELFNLIGNMFFSGQSNPCGISHIVRCRTSRGESFMAMVRARFYVRNGGRFWVNNVAFQPLPMSRFLFPLAKPLGPAESTSSQDSTFASLCVFEEPAQPQGCKTCEVMTKEALSFHFRALTEGPKPEGEESADDVFVSQGSFERMKLEESGSGSGSGDGDEPAKKARHGPTPSYQHSRDVQVLPTPSYIQLPPKEPYMPPPPPVAQMPPTQPQHPPVMASYMPPPQPMSHPAAANPIPMNTTTTNAPPEFDTSPMAPPLGTVGSSDSMPSFNLSPSDVEVLDALLASTEDNEDEEEEEGEPMPASPSWENWDQNQQVGDDFWQHIGVMAPLLMPGEPMDHGVAPGIPPAATQNWGMVRE